MIDQLPTDDGIGLASNDEFKFLVLPTTTVHQSRVQIYEPTRRPTDHERVIATPWGTAKVTGKLGQGHADILEAMCYQMEAWRSTDSGGIEFLVDPYKVRKAANGGLLGCGTQFHVVTKDLMRAIVELDIPHRGIRVRGHIVEEIVESKKTVKGCGFGKGRMHGEPRHLLKVTLGRAYLALVVDDLHLHYDPTPISSLRYGISQAIARHIAMHRVEPPNGWHLEKLLAAVGAGDPRKLGNRRRELKRDAEGLANLGINIEVGRVTVRRRQIKALNVMDVAKTNRRASNA